MFEGLVMLRSINISRFKNIKLSRSELREFINVCEDKYGVINRDHLLRSIDIADSVLDRYPRVYALRLDLRFTNESPDDDADTLICFQRSDPSVITRFMESLKSQLRATHYRKKRRGKPVLPSFIWCRERDSSSFPHYHLILFFDKDIYAYLGGYRDYYSDNMGTRIQRAWCSALSLPYPEHATLVNFPESSQYRFDRHSARELENNFYNFLIRLAYLSKQRTKSRCDGYRNFGSSQINRSAIL
jgi:hypothetical protein